MSGPTETSIKFTPQHLTDPDIHMNDRIDHAVDLVRQADAIVVGAGAGMGIDSGLPDFRGPNGFWRAYPALGRRQIRFEAIASPEAFRRWPRLAWGFYGHRLKLYRQTRPHEGFRILQNWAAETLFGISVFTSNVDGQFQTAGFPVEAIHECHGSIHRLQCLNGCTSKTWSAADFVPEVDEATGELSNEDLPRCPHCVSVRSTHLECELRSGHRPHDWRIVETMEQISNEGRPRRREYSKDFKAEVLAKCRQPGASVGGVALAHGLHSNMVHRWIREAGAAYRAPLGMPGSQIAQAMQPRFTPVPLDLLSPAVPQAPAGSADQTAPTAPRPVELQLRRGDLIVSVQCPLEHCGTLLREVLR